MTAGQSAYEKHSELFSKEPVAFSDLSEDDRTNWESLASHVRSFDNPPPNTGGGVGN